MDSVGRLRRSSGSALADVADGLLIGTTGDVTPAQLINHVVAVNRNASSDTKPM